MEIDFKKIENINDYVGGIPSGYDLVVTEEGDETFEAALVLYGFDEVGQFDGDFTKPMYGFLKLG